MPPELPQNLNSIRRAAAWSAPAGRGTDARVAVVGVGGLGSHVVQQLAFLGVRAIAPIDAKELALTNRNRLVGMSEDDPIPGTRKVDIAERTAKTIDGSIVVDKVFDSFVSKRGFDVLIGADYVFGCLDSEGARLVLTELSAAYAEPYVDVSSDILPGDPGQLRRPSMHCLER